MVWTGSRCSSKIDGPKPPNSNGSWLVMLKVIRKFDFPVADPPLISTKHPHGTPPFSALSSFSSPEVKNRRCVSISAKFRFIGACFANSARRSQTNDSISEMGTPTFLEMSFTGHSKSSCDVI
ncbi:hypothetical protein OGAPHI_005234 [Ogataea philodendri]|uniref:Uncharacterized protein n=1 Tax=Ogataea philodendri TaxID=1378263 RepID=A0A9P8T3I0_9ASCO|nr:uncharacterized protein OGAPHI_005234 [Ogataea philodendri]KAH3663831.1 hypothetical protein OGAPHI_005234 [Ogataea philodendri]